MLVPFPTYFIFILSPQPLRPTTEISRLLCSSVVANSKICCGRSRNSSIVESQGYFVLEWPFLRFHEQRGQIRQRSKSPYSLLWESGLSATFTLNDAHQAATKDEKWLWTYQKSQIHHIWAFIAIQRSKMTTSQWTFPVNSSLQCFRTAALSMVTLNMESRNPMGRVNAENHSKTWKSSGVNGLSKKNRGHVTRAFDTPRRKLGLVIVQT